MAPEAAAVTLTREQVSLRLREVALFQGLGQDDLAEILQISEAVRVDDGEYVFEEGERGDHFYVIVHGSVELRKATGSGYKRLAVLRAGQAFGEMALLNQTPRSASAIALEDTYLLSVSRAAFSRMLGGDTLSVRLLKNLSKALWATSVRLASQQTKASTDNDTGHETLSEFNRLLRARLLPRVTPRVSGYEIAASTLAPRQGTGCTAWDWFVLADGRPAFVVTKAMRSDVFAAQRLAAVRMLLRSAAADPHESLGSYLTKVNRGLRAGWIEGLSGPVMVGLVALADGAAEWVEAGPLAGVVVRDGGIAEDLSAHAPPLGEDADRIYRSTTMVLGDGDRVVAVTDAHTDALRTVGSALADGQVSNAREALAKMLAELDLPTSGGPEALDVSAALITRTTWGR
jgi:CRP/FNR family transcriptional regulator, cyclic AMP receptor protein